VAGGSFPYPCITTQVDEGELCSGLFKSMIAATTSSLPTPQIVMKRSPFAMMRLMAISYNDVIYYRMAASVLDAIMLWPTHSVIL
jgi:hypothetical protein